MNQPNLFGLPEPAKPKKVHVTFKKAEYDRNFPTKKKRKLFYAPITPVRSQGQDLKDAGIAKAIEHSEDILPGWRDKALKHLKRFAETHKTFRAEEVRNSFEGVTVSARAWGGIMVSGAKAGWIKTEKTVKVENPAAHQANAALWESIIYKGNK